MKPNTIIYFGFISVFGMLSACTEPDPRAALFQQPYDTWEDEVAKMPAEMQYDHYIYGMKNIRPPAMALGIPIAKNAKKTAPIVMKHLSNTKDRSEIEAIGLVIMFMHSVEEVNLCENYKYKNVILDRFETQKFHFSNEIIDLCAT